MRANGTKNRQPRSPNIQHQPKHRRKVVEIGLALGGLGGNNAHGAGVLQAALDCNVHPDIISCTSGQIHWVHKYLMARREKEPAGLLRRILQANLAEQCPTGFEWLDIPMVASKGIPGVMRWATPEYPFNLMKNAAAITAKIITGASTQWPPRVMDWFELACPIPAQTLIPLRPDAFFKEISDAFNHTELKNETGNESRDPVNNPNNEIGIVFNSYDFRRGVEYVHLNQRACTLLDVAYGEREYHREGTEYQPITPNAVRQGLWLYEYGEPQNINALDGCYYRQMMLSELAPAKTIYAARPINSNWLGSFPDNWYDREDLKTEVSFIASYAGERNKIKFINRMLKDKKFAHLAPIQQEYHEIELVPIELTVQRGYGDYACESVQVFDDAYEHAKAIFMNRKKKPSPIPPGPPGPTPHPAKQRQNQNPPPPPNGGGAGRNVAARNTVSPRGVRMPHNATKASHGHPTKNGHR